MAKLLEQLTKRAQNEVIEALRILVSACNGIAGIYQIKHQVCVCVCVCVCVYVCMRACVCVLVVIAPKYLSSSQWQEAVDMYRQVIKIWEEHSNDVIVVDRLQRIHTLENMADLLDADHSFIRNESYSVNTDQCADQSSTIADKCSSNTDQCSSNVDQSSSNTDQYSSNADQCSTNTDQHSTNADQSSTNTDQYSSNAHQHSNADQCSTNTDQSSTNTDQSCSYTDQDSNTDQSTISKKPLRDEDLRSEVCYNNTKIYYYFSEF